MTSELCYIMRKTIAFIFCGLTKSKDPTQGDYYIVNTATAGDTLTHRMAAHTFFSVCFSAFSWIFHKKAVISQPEKQIFHF